LVFLEFVATVFMFKFGFSADEAFSPLDFPFLLFQIRNAASSVRTSYRRLTRIFAIYFCDLAD